MTKHDLKIVSFNVRGLNNDKKRIAIFKYLKINQTDIALLQETYSNEEDTIKWIQEWEGSGYCVHGSKHSRGVMILFRKGFDVEILSQKLDTKGRFIIMKVKVNDEAFNLINIYAPNKEKEQIQFYEDLIHVIAAENIASSDSNILAGDWNVVLDIKLDKHGGLDTTKSKSLDKLNKLINILELEDIWRIKHGNTKRFTW